MLLVVFGAARADGRLLVVIDEASGVERLTHEQVVNIFLGRFRQLPNGLVAIPIDRPQDERLMADFYRLLVDKTPAEIRSYWSRLIFSGKTAPPRQAQSSTELLAWLTKTPGTIAYMRPEEHSPRLIVVLTLGP